MIVDNKLLQKYHMGMCTSKEKKAVEAWLASGEYNEPLNIPEKEKATHKEHIWEQIMTETNQTTPKFIPLYKKITRYAAVACVIIGIFFAGRYSTILTTTKTSNIQQSNLLVYGGNGTHAKIPGDDFNLQFDGQLKLYNGSTSIKTVKVGSTTYTLEPQKTYVLMGDNQKSSLIAGLEFEIEQDGLGELKGDFSIKVITA